ncbi:putative DNA-binding domain-containing protein [Thalassotalea euphylliae]|uniref:HvfC/BufC family peptide modification chaperone n=1 Tax=Thalassotalea euphylliae TaxID=1655234 RepID=UPI00362EC1EC
MSLKAYQNALLSAIQQPAFSPTNEAFDDVGLQIYRNNYVASAKRSLGIVFPQTQKLLGENFNVAVNHFLANAVRKQADWAEVGEEFPTYLHQEAALADMPFVAELASLELAMSKSERTKDIPHDLATLTLLESEDSSQLKMEFAPGFTLLVFRAPIYALYQHLIESESFDLDTFDTEKLEVTTQVAEDIERETLSQEQSNELLAVYRIGFRAHIEQLSYDEYIAYQVFTEAASIDDALTRLTDTKFELSTWLANAISKQALYRIDTVASPC